MLIHNPLESKAKIETIYNRRLFEIKPGDTVKVEDKGLSEHLMNTYGFLEVLDSDEQVEQEMDKFICKYCGRECKAKIGLISHEKACDKNPDNIDNVKEAKKIEKKIKEREGKHGVKTLTPKAKLVPKGKKSRSDKEDEGFNDMPGVTGKQVTEKGATGEEKQFSYDRDGVGWYGPGIEEDSTDFTPSGLLNKSKPNKNGKFN